MSHYYLNDNQLDHEIMHIQFKIGQHEVFLETDRGIFSRQNLDFGSRVLLEHIDFDQPYKHIIDMGCGYGPIGIFCAKSCPKSSVLLADVNQRAVGLANHNIEKNHVKNARAIESFLFENIKQKADLIISNPPIRAGKKTVFNLYEQSFDHLNKNGVFYAVIQKKQGAPSSVKKLEELFGNCEIVAKEKGYWVLLSKKMF